MQAMLVPPPRHVPLSLRVVNLFNGFTQFGWVFFGFGMIFFWVFAGNADMSWLTFRGPLARAVGRVTKVEDTNASQNGSRIQANHYEFSVAGTKVSGKSYGSGSNSVSTGDEVTIEYDEKHPERSRIEGDRLGMFSGWLLFVTIFPLVGVAIIIPSFLSGMKRNRLLRDGILTTGRYKSRRQTNVRINDRPVWELTFEFTARDGRHMECQARTTDTSSLRDEAEEPLLYDPENPERAYMLDEAPSRPKVLNGELQGRMVPAMLSLIIPGISIIGHGLVLWLKIIL